MRLVITVLLLAVAVGCSGAKAKDEVVPIDQVPPPLLKVARETLPDVKFDRARKKPDGVYEIQGKTKAGKVREVEVDPSGKVVAIE
ncbi:MAG TPA: hypothetical protein VFA26_04185 [Gemmataceae bacterium]|nr:hypothetical protein [Gemmataceae bacterium]